MTVDDSCVCLLGDGRVLYTEKPKDVLNKTQNSRFVNILTRIDIATLLLLFFHFLLHHQVSQSAK